MSIGRKAMMALLLTAFLLTPASAYMGKQLARGPVDAFTLTDQHGEEFSFETDAEGVVRILHLHPMPGCLSCLDHEPQRC